MKISKHDNEDMILLEAPMLKKPAQMQPESCASLSEKSHMNLICLIKHLDRLSDFLVINAIVL